MTKKNTQNKSTFSPLVFLSSLGAGGLSVGAFIIIQYSIFQGTGLAAFSSVDQTPLVIALEVVMLLLALVHFTLTLVHLPRYISWLGSATYREVRANPLVHSTLMAPFISFIMSMNVIVASVRYFTPTLQEHFQQIMPIAFVFFVLLFVLVIREALALLVITLKTKFEVQNINFGWLLSSFAVAMAAVTASGFAALSHTAWVAHSGSLLAIIALTLAVFLFVIKSMVIYTQHVQRAQALDYQFMPTYLVGIPILTLVGITLFRLGHYADHLLALPVAMGIAQVVIISLFAVQLWMLALGLGMMRGYWSGFLAREYHVSQWGLICPFVALVALGGFVNKLYFASGALLYLQTGLLVATLALFAYLLLGQVRSS